MKRKILVVALSFIAVALLVVGIVFASKGFKSKYDGVIEIKVVDLEKQVIKDKKIEFVTDDTLVSLVESNFDNVEIQDGMVNSIESLQNASDWSTFIAIYINGEMANYGIETLPFKDGDVIEFALIEFTYDF